MEGRVRRGGYKARWCCAVRCGAVRCGVRDGEDGEDGEVVRCGAAWCGMGWDDGLMDVSTADVCNGTARSGRQDCPLATEVRPRSHPSIQPASQPHPRCCSAYLSPTHVHHLPPSLPPTSPSPPSHLQTRALPHHTHTSSSSSSLTPSPPRLQPLSRHYPKPSPTLPPSIRAPPSLPLPPHI